MNQKWKMTLLIFITCVAPKVLMADISKDLEQAIKKSGLSAGDFGVYVADDHGQSLYSLNEERLMVPASLTKILTAAAALDYFTPGEKFVTTLQSDGSIVGSSLKGNLYFKGSGDPTFVSENMWYLVNEFTRNQITQIDGSLVVDDLLFDSERFDPGRDPNRVDRAYDAPIGAASMNWNSINVFVRPALKAGDPAMVFADPYSAYIKLINNVKTGGKIPTINLERIDGKTGDTLRVSGNIPVGQNEIVKYASVSKPDYWTGEYLREFLKQRGITVTGSVTVGKTPSSAKVLAKVDGRPMYEILSDMMKFSNNYIAEMLTKHFAIKSGKSQGTMAVGLQAIALSLQKRGLTSADFSLTSPSGLSQKNRIKAKKLGELLISVHKDLKIFPEFASSYPIGGVDGTLKSRLKGTKAEGRVRGKTGLLSGAIGLAGYAGRSDGTTISYVFLYNGGGDVTRVWSLFDQMAVILVD